MQYQEPAIWILHQVPKERREKFFVLHKSPEQVSSRSSVGCCFGCHRNLTFSCLLVFPVLDLQWSWHSVPMVRVFVFSSFVKVIMSGNSNLQWPTDIFKSFLSSHTQSQRTKNPLFSLMPLPKYFYVFWEGPARYSRRNCQVRQAVTKHRSHWFNQEGGFFCVR